MVIPDVADSGTRTRLYFGSAVVPTKDPKTGKATMGFGFRALLEFTDSMRLCAKYIQS